MATSRPVVTVWVSGCAGPRRTRWCAGRLVAQLAFGADVGR